MKHKEAVSKYSRICLAVFLMITGNPFVKIIEEGLHMTNLLASGVFDWTLCFWILVLNVFGQKIVKKIDMPKWMLPTPILIFFASMLISSLFGIARCPAGMTTEQMVRRSVWSGLVNGFWVWLLASANFDVVHSILKQWGEDVKAVFKKMFKKEEKSGEV